MLMALLPQILMYCMYNMAAFHLAKKTCLFKLFPISVEDIDILSLLIFLYHGSFLNFCLLSTNDLALSPLSNSTSSSLFRALTFRLRPPPPLLSLERLTTSSSSSSFIRRPPSSRILTSVHLSSLFPLSSSKRASSLS